jgi:hypothetical protein
VLNTAQFSSLTIVPLNKAPNIALAALGDISPISLDGTVTDDSFPVPVSLTTQWSQISGPGTITLGNPALIATTATFTASGSHSLRLLADDSSITSFRDVSFSAYLTPFARWLDQNGVGDENNTLAEADADMDKDGLANLFEYAVGTNGIISSANPQVTTLAPISADKYLRIAIPKNPAATDISFTVEASSDLANPLSWNSAGLVIEINNSTTLQVRDNVPAGPGVQRFMRVKVTR